MCASTSRGSAATAAFKRGARAVEVSLMEIERAEREVRFGARLDGERTLQLRDRVLRPIDAFQHQRQVVVRQRMIGTHAR